MRKRAPKIQKRPEYQPPKPLWHFGWRGWTLLPIAIGLAGVLIGGIDGRYYLFRAVQWLFGDDALMAFTDYSTLYLLGLERPGSIGVGPISMCLVLLAISIHPRRFRWWEYAIPVACGLSAPIASTLLCAFIQTTFAQVPGSFRVWTDVVITLALTLGALLPLTRSRMATIALAAITLAGAGVRALDAAFALSMMSNQGSWIDDAMDGPVLGLLTLAVHWLWLPSIALVLLGWAIRTRRRWKPPWACQSCGYDLRGTPAAPCPECGTPPVDRHEPGAAPIADDW